MKHFIDLVRKQVSRIFWKAELFPLLNMASWIKVLFMSSKEASENWIKHTTVAIVTKIFLFIVIGLQESESKNNRLFGCLYKRQAIHQQKPSIAVIGPNWSKHCALSCSFVYNIFQLQEIRFGQKELVFKFSLKNLTYLLDCWSLPKQGVFTFIHSRLTSEKSKPKQHMKKVMIAKQWAL